MARSGLDVAASGAMHWPIKEKGHSNASVVPFLQAIRLSKNLPVVETHLSIFSTRDNIPALSCRDRRQGLAKAPYSGQRGEYMKSRKSKPFAMPSDADVTQISESLGKIDDPMMRYWLAQFISLVADAIVSAEARGKELAAKNKRRKSKKPHHTALPEHRILF